MGLKTGDDSCCTRSLDDVPTEDGLLPAYQSKDLVTHRDVVYQLAVMQGAHSVLGPASPQATAIAHLASLFFELAAIVWIIVLAFLAYSLLRPRRLAERDTDAGITRRQMLGVSAALGLSALM